MRWRHQQAQAHTRFRDREAFWRFLRTLNDVRDEHSTWAVRRDGERILRQLNDGADAEVLAALLQQALEETGIRNQMYEFETI